MTNICNLLFLRIIQFKFETNIEFEYKFIERLVATRIFRNDFCVVLGMLYFLYLKIYKVI